jgi:hypothetical protein
VAGSDSNPCSITQPCRHFSAAVAATSVEGEVDALDPGAYGSFTIGHAISIEGQGWSYVAPPANGNAITINALAGDNVNIRGVSLNGVGVAMASGIQFNSGGSLTVRDSVIRNFSEYGILFQPSASSQIFVSKTLIADNGLLGLVIEPAGSGTTNGVVDRVQLENNGTSVGSDGLVVETSTQTINVTVSDSVSTNNSYSGIAAFSFGTTPVNVMVRNTTITNNGADGLQTIGAGATIHVTRSTITGNATGWVGAVSSFGDNDIFGNNSVNSAPASVSHE